MATEEIVIRERRRKYNWPEAQLNLWILVVLGISASITGIFAWFMVVQSTLRLGTPWILPYMVTIGSLSIGFVGVLLFLAAQRYLIPGIILLGAFGLFVLWLTGLVETGIQLYGSGVNIDNQCKDLTKFKGVSIETLAWLTQKNICDSWRASFGLELGAVVFFIWLMVMAWQVHNDEFSL